MDDRLWTAAQVAARYGVTTQTVRMWVRDGLPLAVASLRDPVTGRLVRGYFWPDDVARYVEARKASGRWGKRGRDKRPRRLRGPRADRAKSPEG